MRLVRQRPGSADALLESIRCRSDHSDTVSHVALHQRADHGTVGRVAADQAMLADGPDIARAGHRHHRCIRHVVCGVRFIGLLFLGDFFGSRIVCEQCCDLSILKTGQREVVPGVGQLSQLQRKQLLVPARIECQPVVGDDVGALL